MPSISGLKSDADEVRRSTNDPDVSKLAQTVYDLCRKVKELEDKVQKLER